MRNDVSLPGLRNNELRLKNKQLQDELARQEAAMLVKSSQAFWLWL